MEKKTTFEKPNEGATIMIAIMLTTAKGWMKNAYAGKGRSRKREPMGAANIAAGVAEGLDRVYRFRKDGEALSRDQVQAIVEAVLNDMPLPLVKDYVGHDGTTRQATVKEMATRIFDALEAGRVVSFEVGHGPQYGGLATCYPQSGGQV